MYGFTLSGVFESDFCLVIMGPATLSETVPFTFLTPIDIDMSL